MPSWMIPIVLKMLAQVITSDNVKGVEAELIKTVENAIGPAHPMAAGVVKMLGEALGVTA